MGFPKTGELLFYPEDFQIVLSSLRQANHQQVLQLDFYLQPRCQIHTKGRRDGQNELRTFLWTLSCCPFHAVFVISPLDPPRGCERNSRPIMSSDNETEGRQ